jgi:hypothetical protein
MKMLHKKAILFSIIEKTASNMDTTMKIINFKKNLSEYITVSMKQEKKSFKESLLFLSGLNAY